jgi:hypothetical protein
MCKKDPYNCGKGPVYTVFNLKITVSVAGFRLLGASSYNENVCMEF